MAKVAVHAKYISDFLSQAADLVGIHPVGVCNGSPGDMAGTAVPGSFGKIQLVTGAELSLCEIGRNRHPSVVTRLNEAGERAAVTIDIRTVVHGEETRVDR